MLFNSIEFLFFFAIVTTLYFTIPHKLRWFLLLSASCYFYMVFVPVYILILGFTIVIDYFAGIYLEKLHGKQRKWFLIASLIANIGVLAVFKYYNFFNNNFTLFLKDFALENPIPFLSILLPIGLSFHTFQAMSYTIEVYKGRQKAEKNFGIYALYVMFYPQLVAGPIERPQNMLPQFYIKHHFDINRTVEGLKIMLWGFFKKVVIADSLAIYVNSVYAGSETHSGITLALATVFFAFQIYCDFSGYSDIAIGAAHIMGFKLMQNFNLPYFASSISEFWKRWHISLSTWFADYVYKPLGGNRVSTSRWLFNIFLVFTISGFWHGANWTFIVWGALHGLYYLIEFAGNSTLGKIEIKKSWLSLTIYFVKVIFIFILVCISWIFFRATDISQAVYILTKIFTNFSGTLYLGSSFWTTFLSVCFIAILLFVEILQYRGVASHYLSTSKIPRVFRWSGYIAMLIAIFIFARGSNNFIYFQF